MIKLQTLALDCKSRGAGNDINSKIADLAARQFLFDTSL